ncbi:MAG: hypothetical protein DDT31_00015 [Syntrophomonadaceae bacterium]|nr:hypothetical protein [Bacillota bacterium]
MTQKNDFALNHNNLINYIPKNLRNPVNTGLLDNLFNRFLTRDESVPMYGYVGRRPTNVDDKSPRLPQHNTERDINAVVPVINFKVGDVTHAFTIEDILNKAKVLSIDTAHQGWLYSQGNNFRPPIDFDKFTNFFNYYWVTSSIVGAVDTPWNPEKRPEYYVIAPPKPTDLDKMNVVAATRPGQNLILSGSGFLDQQFVITFTSPTNFTVSTVAPLLGPNGLYTPTLSSITGVLSIPALQPTVPVANHIETFTFQVTGPAGIFTLLTFSIAREATYDSLNNHSGWTTVSAGDVFTIDTTYLSPNYNVMFTGSSGVKPKILGVIALNAYQTIDGHQLQSGDRVLVKNQSNSTENGIYVVSKQNWLRARDFTVGSWSAGARVFVTNGTININSLWISSGAGPVFGWTQASGVTESNTNDWQEGNFWVKGDELEVLNIDRSSVTQAIRPIIEYEATLQLNRFISAAGTPAESGTYFKQEKTKFNQLPLFDLFRYDGTHANVVSSIFYYVEDLSAGLDLALQRRVKRANNNSADFVFNHGCADENGSLLFFKKNDSLHTVWHSGYLSETVVDHTFDGTGNGTLKDITAAHATQQQIWTLVATSPTTFKVAGSKVPQIPSFINLATVGLPYLNADIGFTINAGTTPFVSGDTFTLRIGNLERPRYSFRAIDGSIQDLYGGPSADVNGVGAYQISQTFINNPYNDSRSEMSEGAVFTHFRSILNNQLVSKPINYSFGGAIKLWSEQHTLLASLLMQRDFTPMSMIDMAKRQYETGLNTLRDLYLTRVVDYFSSVGVVNSDGTPANTAKVNSLLDYLLSFRAQDQDVRTVLFDSTAAVIGFPATLPQLGLAELIEPIEIFDLVLGLNVLVHHDGHKSVLAVDDFVFRDTLLGNLTSKHVLRSNGTYTPAFGSFTSTPPTTPYKGELWMKQDDETMATILAFDVQFDLPTTPPIAGNGARWYNRSTNTLYESNGFSWIIQPSPTVAWVSVNFAETLNELLFITEQRLFNGINPDQRKYDYSSTLASSTFQLELKRELFNFAALNNYDPLATDYNQTDAFTFNYSQARVVDLPPLATSTTPARWHRLLKAHQSTVVGVIPTERPHVEPWKLFGFNTYSSWWSSLSPTIRAAYTPHVLPEELNSGAFINAGVVRAVKTVPGITSLMGITTIDSVTLAVGDRILLVSETNSANNGIWIISVGPWARAPIPLIVDTFITVSEGSRYATTQWVLTSTVTNINTDPVIFGQAREWTEVLWSDLATIRPSLRTSVNPWTGDLLPPYVNASRAASAYALTTILPTGIALPFEFGDSSPVEEVWSRSIEYGYALAKSLFRYDPFALLGFAWGFAWVEVDGILYDGADLNMPGHKRFRLHGESITPVDRSNALVINSVSGTHNVDVTLVYDAYDVNRKQNFSIRDTATGTLLDTITEGTIWNFTNTFAGQNIQLNGIRIDDFGKPFNMGDSFRITSILGEATPTITFTPILTHHIYGLGQTFTHALREVSVGTSNSYAISAFREWEVNMGYRVGSLVSTDDLVIYNDNNTLNESSYTLLLKKNEVASDKWIQALRITVLQYGERGVIAPTKSGAQYRGTQGNFPAGDGSDWVFRIEGYNPRFTSIAYNTLKPIPSGLTFPNNAVIGSRFFRHDKGEYFEFNGLQWNLVRSSDLITFNALDQDATTLTFFQSTVKTGTVNTFLPLTIIGAQALCNFLFGYASYCEEQGWRFNTGNEYNIDAQTGRHRNFQLEIEKFIDILYRGIELGQGVIINPFMDRIWLQQDMGMLSEFIDTSLFDITGNPGVFDVLGVRYKTTDLRPIRGNLQSSIAATGPMFSVHAQLDEFEHLFIFNNYVNASTQDGLLYDPFSGSRAITYKFNGRKANNITLRPEFGGHYISGGLVRPNLQASTDNIENAFDSNLAFENTVISKHALAILGFNPKSYFDKIGITQKTQFNFWRGLIHSKGTNLSIDAYLNSNRSQDASIDEYWAYKIAEYGDSRQHAYPELRLRVSDTLQQFTQLQFDAPVGSELTNFIQINRFDESRWFSIDDLDHDTYFKAEPIGSFVKTVVAGEIITLPFIADRLVIVGVGATRVNAVTLQIDPLAIGTPIISIVGFGPATPRYNPIKLFNHVADTLVEEIPHWHPAIGQHTPTALGSINIIGDIDQARYNYSTLVQGNNSFDPLRPWGEAELGRVWFDTRNLTYMPYYDPLSFPNHAERLSRWGAITEYATIDVYEWVKSTVPPAGYAALAAIEALDADVAPTNRASGSVALAETYIRDRIWSIRPIAWSQTGTMFGGHPSFNGSFNSRLFMSGNNERATLELGTFAERGISVGMRIGAWDPDPAGPKTISEAIISSLTKDILFGASGFSPRLVSLGSVDVAFVEYTEQTGYLVFSAEPIIGVPRLAPDATIIGYSFEIAIRVTDVDTGQQFIFTIDSLSNNTNVLPNIILDDRQTYTFGLTPFGLSVSITITNGGSYPGSVIQDAIITALGANINTMDAAVLIPVADNRFTSGMEMPNVIDNDPFTATNINNQGIGWVAWNVPTQAQLDSDGRQPNSIWKPYPGDYAEFSPSEQQLADAIAFEAAPLKLNNGTFVSRYSTRWNDWSVLKGLKTRIVSISGGTVLFTHIKNIDPVRTTVYINGIAQLRVSYNIVGPEIQVFNVLPGQTVDIIIRKYSPSIDELAFNPEVEDNLTFQQQYKVDYEYVSIQSRDSNGSIFTHYYFWVKNRSIAAQGKNLSVQAIEQELRNGPPSYLTFQNIIDAAPGLPYRYDAITISGLGFIVTKDDTYKLRFTRNFTLRAELEDAFGSALKNVHTEWGLIRPAQKRRIPENLWNKLVDSMAGEDAAGNTVPSLRRVLYDERTGANTRLGFGPEQTLAPHNILIPSVLFVILNTKLIDSSGEFPIPDFISILDFGQSDKWFNTPANVRTTMSAIWNNAKAIQVNEIFFAALEDILASNLELSDIFKTSRLSAYSIHITPPNT